METIRKIELHTQEINVEKKKFYASSAKIGEKWYKIKFTQDCKDAPRQKGLYELTIDLDECSLEVGKYYTAKDGTMRPSNSTIWVRHIVGLRKYTEDELKALNREAFSDVFGE